MIHTYRIWLFIHPWRTFGLFPPFACCEQCCCEHVYTCVCTCIYLNTCFQFSWAYSRSGIVRRSFDATKNCSYTLQVYFISNTITHTGNNPHSSLHHSPPPVDPSLVPLHWNQIETWCFSSWCHKEHKIKGAVTVAARGLAPSREARELLPWEGAVFTGAGPDLSGCPSVLPILWARSPKDYINSTWQNHQGLPFSRLKVWIIFSSKESTNEGAG